MGYAGSQFHCGPDYLDNPLAELPVLPPSDPFASAGPQNALFLNAITALAGVGNNALAAIVTGAVTVPYKVSILDPAGSGAIQTWVLQTSSTPTGPGAQRPNDWSVTNNKVWILVS